MSVCGRVFVFERMYRGKLLQKVYRAMASLLTSLAPRGMENISYVEVFASLRTLLSSYTHRWVAAVMRQWSTWI